MTYHPGRNIEQSCCQTVSDAVNDRRDFLVGIIRCGEFACMRPGAAAAIAAGVWNRRAMLRHPLCGDESRKIFTGKAFPVLPDPPYDGSGSSALLLLRGAGGIAWLASAIEVHAVTAVLSAFAWSIPVPVGSLPLLRSVTRLLLRATVIEAVAASVSGAAISWSTISGARTSVIVPVPFTVPVTTAIWAAIPVPVIVILSPAAVAIPATVVAGTEILAAIPIRATTPVWIRPAAAPVVVGPAVGLPVTPSAVDRRAGRLAPPVPVAFSPAIAFAIEIAVAIISVPVYADIEIDQGNTEALVVTWLYIDPVLPVDGLDIIACDPPASACEGHVTPRNLAKATVDHQRRSARYDHHCRIIGSRSGTHVDVGR